MLIISYRIQGDVIDRIHIPPRTPIPEAPSMKYLRPNLSDSRPKRIIETAHAAVQIIANKLAFSLGPRYSVSIVNEEHFNRMSCQYLRL
jgi:hypothetical protein